MKTLAYTLLALLLLVSCDAQFKISGIVIDNSTNMPIAGAKITTFENEIVYSRSNGKFFIDLFGPGSLGDKKVLLIEMPGYQYEYIDISKNSMDLVIKLNPNPAVKNYKDANHWVRYFYWINLIVSLINLVTIIFIISIQFRWKILWIFGILFLNFVLSINHITSDINFQVIHWGFFVKHSGFYPFIIKIVVPAGTILFWIVFCVRKKNPWLKKTFFN